MKVYLLNPIEILGNLFCSVKAPSFDQTKQDKYHSMRL